MVKSCRELGYRGEFVFELGLGCEVFKLVDVLLKPIVRSSIFVLSWPLDKSGQVSSSSEFGVEGVEVLIIVFGELTECLFLGFDTGISHLIVPFLRERHSFPSVHFAKDEGDLQLIRVVDLWVDGEICVHGFEPSWCL